MMYKTRVAQLYHALKNRMNLPQVLKSNICSERQNWSIIKSFSFISRKHFLRTNKWNVWLVYTQWETYVYQKKSPLSRLHHYLDHFKASLLYFILKMSILKGVQAWPQQSLCSSSLERCFTCATPCLRRWSVSYSPRLIKGIYGAKKNHSQFLLFAIFKFDDWKKGLCTSV